MECEEITANGQLCSNGDCIFMIVEKGNRLY